MKPKNINGIDFFKFIMAIIVVAIHTSPLVFLENNFQKKIWQSVAHLAVPYFFIASGYTLFLNFQISKQREGMLKRIKMYIKRIGVLYIVWTIIYIPFAIYDYHNNDVGFIYDFVLFIRGMVLIGDHFYSWPLWYLLSLFYSLLIIYYLLLKNKSIMYIFICSMIFFILSLIINQFLVVNYQNGFLGKITYLFSYTFGSGRLFIGFLYVMIGVLLASYNTEVNSNKGKVLFFALLVIAIYFQIYPTIFISKLLFVLIVTSIFKYSLSLKLNNDKLGYWFRKCSTVMYFTHMIFFFYYTLIFKSFVYYGYDAFTISIILPTIFTFIVIKYQSKFKILKTIF